MRFGKTGGAVAALALVSVFVFGGVEVAHADNYFTMVAFDSSGATNPTLVLHGTAEPSAPITVTATSAEAADAPYCQTTADGGGSWYCTKDNSPAVAQVHFGSNVFTATDGTSTVSSTPIIIYGTGGPALTSPGAGSSVLPYYPVFFGYGPARGSIDVIANVGGTVCTVAQVPDSGQWSCHSSAILPEGANGFTVRSITPGYPSVGYDSRDSNPVPVTVSELTAPAVSYTMGYATGSSTATTPFENVAVATDLYSITEPSGEGNGYVSSPYPELSCGPVVAPGPLACDFGNLAPGIWTVDSYQYAGEMSAVGQNDFFRIPEAPTMVANGHADQTVSFSGTGTTGDLATVIAEDGTTVCSATVVAGTWSCTATAIPGNHSYRAYQLDQGWTPHTDDSGNVDEKPLGIVLSGKSALTAPATATVPAASTPATPTPAVPTPTTPPAAQSILNWLLTVTGMNGPLQVGDTVTLSSSGLPAGSTVSLFIHSTPVSLGSAVVAKNGTFSKTVTIPEGVEPGDHHFVATITVPGSTPSTVESPVTIAAPEELSTLSVPSTSDPTPAPAEAASGNSHGKTAHTAVAPRNKPAAPSSFSNALPTLSTLIDNPGALAVALGLALAIMLLVAIPTELLNSTITSNLDRFGSFFTRAGDVIEKAGGWLTRVTRTQATASVILILVSSIIFGFSDPHYGFDLVSLRLTLSLAIAMFIVYYLASLISGRIAKARWDVESEISMQPIALVFAIVGVVLGRLLGFSPGFLIGLALGLELANTAKSVHRAKALILRTSIIVGLALVAWLGYSLIQLWTAGGQETFWTGLVQDTLVSVTAEGLTGMVLALLPLSFMEGKELWDHSKLLWVGLFLFTGTAFSLLVLPTAMQGEVEGNNLAVWLLVLACFTAVTLALWLYLRLSRGKSAEEKENGEAVDAAKVEA